jgi:exopolysaccharide biosynthesis WecB/TagA/CpsF family protein
VVLGGSSVDLTDRDWVRDAVRRRLTDVKSPPLFLASANLDHLNHFGHGRAHQGLFDHTTDAEWRVLLDGRPLVWAARMVTHRAWPQLAGSDLLPDILSIANDEGARVGFLGGSDLLHERLLRMQGKRWPNISIGGQWRPQREHLEDRPFALQLAQEIREREVALLVVALGRPHEELWLSRYGSDSGVRVATAFGAAGDFIAGLVPRAPESLRRSGLEWAYRLAHEPNRLWRRYLVQGPGALVRLIRHSGL